MAYASPYTGAWKRSIEYTGAAKWGTGYNPIHAVRMGTDYNDLTAHPYASDLPKSDISKSQAAFANSDIVETGQGGMWGYTAEDIASTDVYGQGAYLGEAFYVDDLPDWGQDTTATRANIPIKNSHPWGMGLMRKNWLRRQHNGAYSYDDSLRSTKTPTETVNEGWLNKASSGGLEPGEASDAHPSDDSQIFVQTSMTQRYKEQNNNRATMRSGPEGTIDTAREPIKSRVVGMKIKEYSQGERHYDMFPYQHDMHTRPFNFRTAGVGPLGYQVNDQWNLVGLQRTPPPDPTMGVPDTQFQEGYGYETEDQGYY